MKKILGIVVLSLLLSFNANADDIKDFQIEGISIGDSLLKYYSEAEIKKSIAWKQGYKDDTFIRGSICSYGTTFCRANAELKNYDAIVFHFKKNDPEYKLFMIAGIINYTDKIEDCLIEKKSTVQELKILFPKAKYKKKIVKLDKDKKNKAHTSYFFLDDGSASRVQCYDWSKSKKRLQIDSLKITLDHPQYIDWNKNKAF